MHLSFDYRKNDVEIEKLEHKIIDPNEDKFEKKLAKIELEEKTLWPSQYGIGG